MQTTANIERMDVEEISGWAYVAERPMQRVELEILYRNTSIGRCVADQMREDLAKAGISDGRCAFKFHMPLIPKGQMKHISVKVSKTDQFIHKGDTGPGIEARNLNRFGGLWIDRPDFIAQLAHKKMAGLISEDLGLQLFKFVRDGYLVIPNAVSKSLIDSLNAEIEDFWRSPPNGMMIETYEPDRVLKVVPPRLEYRDGATKLRDLYAFSPLAQEATMAPKVIEFLSAIFEEKPTAFQSLYFWKGSEQAIHKDTAYVRIDNEPMHLAASWLALEDIKPFTGELEYFVGSHRAPDYLFEGAHKWMPENSSGHSDFLASLHSDAETYGHTRGSFLARKGDVLIWHADLAHGGSPIRQHGASRKSLVTHFTGTSDQPFYLRETNFRPLEAARCNFVSGFADVRVPDAMNDAKVGHAANNENDRSAGIANDEGLSGRSA